MRADKRIAQGLSSRAVRCEVQLELAEVDNFCDVLFKFRFADEEVSSMSSALVHVVVRDKLALHVYHLSTQSDILCFEFCNTTTSFFVISINLKNFTGITSDHDFCMLNISGNS